MIINIVLILCSLVVLNFLLLIFSCNKTSKKNDGRIPHFAKEKKESTVVSNQLQRRQLAATGS